MPLAVSGLKPSSICLHREQQLEFGPLKLQAVRQHMIDLNRSRGVINHRVNRIKRFLEWATS